MASETASPQSELTTSQARILIVDDDAEIRYSLHRVLSRRNHVLFAASSGEEGVKMAKEEKPEVIFLDNRMEGMSGLETLQHLRTACPKAMVILMTAFGTTQTAIEAMKFGAFDYIVKPFDVKKVLSLTESAIKSYRDIAAAEKGPGEKNLLNADDYAEGMVGNSEKMQEVFKTIGQVAANDFTVLVTGESGTGKELVARCIRRHSHLSEKPFMAVNCAAIPDNLIESELFGHERGSFTGASQQRIGVFELCDGGTIFLDEIGDMSLSTQTKILRALQEGEIQRVGGSETIKVKVRLVAATNKDLETMVVEKTFREDLYYRLNVVRIRLPALRERLDDIPQLIDFMLKKMERTRPLRVKRVSQEAMGILLKYRWPGNVRELENVIQRASIVAQGETILPKDLPTELREASSRTPFPEKEVSPPPASAQQPQAAEETPPSPAPAEEPVAESTLPAAPAPVVPHQPPPVEQEEETMPIGGTAQPAAVSEAISLDESFDILYKRVRKETDESILQLIERGMIERALKETGGNQVKTSNILGITRATLRKRIDQWGLKY